MRFCFRRSSPSCLTSRPTRAWGEHQVEAGSDRLLRHDQEPLDYFPSSRSPELDHLLTFDEWHPALFLYATLMANIFNKKKAQRE
ncbi:BZ3500_MvSof-1268-A1-R1_Chr7-3g09647 [Microbotryum saponariae]|uniref:BZ3500_MvSof-1268-A1-R1_Chr7-3g09647 protein n=1 Tax=Microbotryum saponariae TaxID=289078 RepID=A0A2X0N5B7_9BASI|nr:BZ3501_MvSof-1269-A2-R1_Chr7-2g09370 [Microbotryum saponariae]SDA02342.1 BZ3500_MvSof-1268-A1-R1_Chr7-3g09647 [Microbotryum saponariae]